jgi:hypothetical protein
MPLSKCYALVHALAEHNGANSVWADENKAGQAAQMQQARSILQSNFLFANEQPASNLG